MSSEQYDAVLMNVQNLRNQISQMNDANHILLRSVNHERAPDTGIKELKLCQGHFGKVYALNWGRDSEYIVTASQDGKLIIWNSKTGNKQIALSLSSSWVMTCAFDGEYVHVASGGLDNTVTLFRVSTGGVDTRFNSKEVDKELEAHDGYVACARFVNPHEIVSASGDASVIWWDIENQRPVHHYNHDGDVMCVALNGVQQNLLLSGSIDMTAKVWDTRMNHDDPQASKPIYTFRGHTSDINTVQWLPDGNGVITGGDDATVRLFDIRAVRQLNEYKKPDNVNNFNEPSNVTSVDVSRTGAYIFAAYDNGHVFVWDTINGHDLEDLQHDNRVSSLAVSPDGYALATGCWDFHLRLYA